MNESEFPEKMIMIENEDKGFHDKWTKKKDKLNFPHPYRIILTGEPNSGKTLTIKNIIIRSKPEFQKIIVVHNDYESTCEYNDLDVIMRGDIPETKDHDGKCKTLIILDDIEFSSLKKDQLANLDRLCGYDSTHKNISVMITSQCYFRLPPIVRRCANIYVLWKIKDNDIKEVIGRKLGLKKGELTSKMNKYLTEKHDSLWFDNTSNSPYPIRKNGFQLIHF